MSDAPPRKDDVTNAELSMMLAEVSRRLARIERVLEEEHLLVRFDRVEQLGKRIEDRLAKGDEELAKIAKHDTRIRMLEDEASNRRWVFRLVVGAAITSFMGWAAIVGKWLITSMSKGTP